MRLNRTMDSSRGFPPYMILYGRPMRLAGEMGRLEPLQAPEYNEQRINRLGLIHEAVKRRLEEAKVKQSIQTNKKRRPAEVYYTDDEVMLSTANLPLQLQYPKISPLWIGPFKVIASYPETDNYKLDLPEEYGRIHPVFHVSLLKKYIPNDDKRFPSRKLHQPGPVPDLEDEDLYELERIVRSRESKTKPGDIEYLCKWVGWSEKDNTWEPAHHLKPEQIEEFNKRTQYSIPSTGKRRRTPQKSKRPQRKTGHRYTVKE